jgi:hypothetical protein
MSKPITIPRRYTVNNASNLGTLTQISGLSYAGNSAIASEIRAKIGASNHSLSVLNSSSAIKKWAAFKPSRWVHSYNGFSYNFVGSPNESDPVVYNTPISDYRIGDWIGYNHSPVVPQLNYWATNGNWKIGEDYPDDWTGGLWPLMYSTGVGDPVPVEPGFNLALTVNMQLGEIDWENLILPDTGVVKPTHIVVSGEFQSQIRYGFVKLSDSINGNNLFIPINRNLSGSAVGFSVPYADNGLMRTRVWLSLLPDQDPALNEYVFSNHNLQLRWPNGYEKSTTYTMANADYEFIYDSGSFSPATLDNGFSYLVSHSSFANRIIAFGVYVEASTTISMTGPCGTSPCLLVQATDTINPANYFWNTVSLGANVLQPGVRLYEFSLSDMSNFLTSGTSSNILVDAGSYKYIERSNLNRLTVKFTKNIP